MKKLLLIALMALMFVTLCVSCDPETKYIDRYITVSNFTTDTDLEYMLKPGLILSDGLWWDDDFYSWMFPFSELIYDLDEDDIISITFCTDTNFIPTSCSNYNTPCDLTYYNTGKIKGYYVVTGSNLDDYEIYIIGEKIFANYNCDGMFYDMDELTEINGLTCFNTSKTTSMNNMFYYNDVSSLDLSSFDTSNVTQMNNMFGNCYELQEVILSPKFVTSNVINMANMFYYCTSLEQLDLSIFTSTTNLKSMKNMFEHCTSLKNLDVSGLDTSNVISMAGMFDNCSALEELDLSNFNTEHVKNMESMFSECSSLEFLTMTNLSTSNLNIIDLENPDEDSDDGRYYMFEGCDNLSTVYAPNNTAILCALQCYVDSDFDYYNGRYFISE